MTDLISADVYSIINIIGGLVTIIIGIIKTGISTINELIKIILQLLSVLITFIPLLTSTLIYCVTHFYLFFILIEVIILGLCIMKKGFLGKIKLFVNLHIALITFIFTIPQIILNLYGYIGSFINGFINAVNFIWDVLKSIVTWIQNMAVSFLGLFGL